MKNFYGYSIRATEQADFALAKLWTPEALRADFWLRWGPFRESFLVHMPDSTPLAFFQYERIQFDQVRLHWQPSPTISKKEILRALTRLVPLIEKALAKNGVKAIFFTSHSHTMAWFMERRLNYLNTEHKTQDGIVMWKVLPGKEFKFTGITELGIGYERTI